MDCPRAYWCRLAAGHREKECLPKGDNWRASFRDIEDEIVRGSGMTGPSVPHPDDAEAEPARP